MLIKLVSPAGKVQNIRKSDVQYYLGHGYKYVDVSADLETVELMSPAGKVVVMKRDVGSYLQREGWSLLVEKASAEDETPEKPAGDETPETPEEPEKPVEDEIPTTPTDEVLVEELESVQEPEIVEADAEATGNIPDGVAEAEETIEQFQLQFN